MLTYMLYHLLSLLSDGSFFLWYASEKQSQKRKELQIWFQLLGKYQKKSLYDLYIFFFPCYWAKHNI